MHTKTKNKIEFLQSHVKRNIHKWYKKYGENLTGVRVDKKRIGKTKKNYYSFVFNVVKKKKKKDLPKGNVISPYFDIKFDDGKIRKIKTDVRQTGEFKFHSRIMDEVCDRNSDSPGTLGLLLRDGRGHVFGLTNYHVAADSLWYNNVFFYDATRHPRHDVEVGGNICRLRIGVFNEDLDVAFIYLGLDLPVSNTLPDGRRVNPDTFIDGPLPATARTKPAVLYVPSRAGRINRPIEDNQAPLNYRSMRFIELVTVRKCTRPGDSGSLVLAGNDEVLGIILGADDEFTYIVPFYKIFNFFPLDII